ncbi:MAG: exopolyphosphatase [Mobilicoccus sp.]|nr:exopolyphosphatase [Mobilicoccus sp.]
MSVAAIDCGTNSLRLLVADVESGAVEEIVRRNEIVRLGEGVDASGRLDSAAMQRAFAVVEDYARVCREHDVTAIRFGATSATRDAANAEEFFAGVRAALPGVEPEIIDGRLEAELSFVGAARALAGTDGDLGATLVIDLGGGSTEFVAGRVSAGEPEVGAAVSVDLGSVRLTERLLHGDPPGHDAIAAAAAEIDARLDEAEAVVALREVDTLIGVAGTVTTLTAHALKLDSYDRSRIHGAAPSVGQTLAACEDMLMLPLARRAELPYLHPGRVDVIGAGALIWSRIVRRLIATSPGLSLRTSESDILDGLALSLR